MMRTALTCIKRFSCLTRSTIVLSAIVAGMMHQCVADTKGSAFANGPQTIASKDRVSVLIDREVADGKRYIVLKISVPTDSTVKAFLLPTPPRVVVDFEGASIKKSAVFPAPPNEVIKQVRLGAHPSKIRFVLDMHRTTPPEYDWKAGKRQAILRFLEGPAEPIKPASTPAQAPVATLPTVVPTAIPTETVPEVPTDTPPTQATETTLAEIEPDLPEKAKPIARVQESPSQLKDDTVEDLGDLEERSSEPKVPTTFSIKGYKFEYLADKTPALKIILNKPRAQAQISKVDEETYKIEIEDCGIDNEDLELPQFPPHDFVGFVMVVAERVGKNTEVSISIEEDIVLGTSVHENEIWVKKP